MSSEQLTVLTAVVATLAVSLGVNGFFMSRLISRLEMISTRLHRLNNFMQAAAHKLELEPPDIYD